MVTPLLSRDGVNEPFIPEQNGYVSLRPVEVIATELEGGSPRLRRDKLHGSATVNATWLLDRVELTLFQKFLREDLQNGSLPCLVDLVTDFFQLARHRCTFVPGTIRTGDVDGLTYRLSAQLRPEQLDAKTTNCLFETPNTIESAAPNTSIFQLGDRVQLIGAQLNDGVNPPINLDGFYAIATIVNGFEMTFASPHLVNPDWLLLASYPSGRTGIIQNVSVVNSPI